MAQRKNPNPLWYILPILFSILGGVIGYVVFRKENKKFATTLLIIGLVVFILSMILSFVLPLMAVGALT